MAHMDSPYGYVIQIVGIITYPIFYHILLVISYPHHILGFADDFDFVNRNSTAWEISRAIYGYTGWWFQTFFIFHNIWDNLSH